MCLSSVGDGDVSLGTDYSLARRAYVFIAPGCWLELVRACYLGVVEG